MFGDYSFCNKNGILCLGFMLVFRRDGLDFSYLLCTCLLFPKLLDKVEGTVHTSEQILAREMLNFENVQSPLLFDASFSCMSGIVSICRQK